MKIVVCVKQVSDTTEIKIDPQKNTLVRAGVPSIMNPYDGYALEAAARIRDRIPETEIYLVTMGPAQAETVLRQGLAIAADKAYLVSGAGFAGSDTMATSYILSETIRIIEQKEKIHFDLIFCGKQAIDGDTAQVGPEIAEYLGLPQVTCGLEAEAEGEILKVLKESDYGKEIIGVRMPCLVTFTKPAFEPRVPTIKRKLAAKKAIIERIGDGEELFDTAKTGLRGSPTRVKKTYVSIPEKKGIIIQEKTVETSVEKLYQRLIKDKIL